MKFALLGSAYPYRGGIAHFTETLGSHLQKKGHDVQIITFTRQYPERLFPGTTQFDAENRKPDVSIWRYVDSLNPKSWWETAKIIAAEKPDVVLIQHWMPFFAPAFGFIARRLRKKGISVVTIVHNALPHEKRFGDVALSQYFFRACTKFVVLAKQSEEQLRALGMTQPIVYHPHPIYDVFGDPILQTDAKQALNITSNAPTLLFFGMIRAYKGLQTLLDAMPAIIAQLPEVRLIIAGEFYDNAEKYHAQIEALGLAHHLLLHTHYIANEDVATYFSAADVVVQPYLTATQSGVTQIAMHFEKPSVVTNVGALPETVQDEYSGFVVPPNDADALARAVIRYFQENWQTRLTEGVQAEKDRFSWTHFCEILA